MNDNRSDDTPEDVLQQHREVIIRWLDELLQDNISVIISPRSYCLLRPDKLLSVWVAESHRDILLLAKVKIARLWNWENGTKWSQHNVKVFCPGALHSEEMYVNYFQKYLLLVVLLNVMTMSKYLLCAYMVKMQLSINFYTWVNQCIQQQRLERPLTSHKKIQNSTRHHGC